MLLKNAIIRAVCLILVAAMAAFYVIIVVDDIRDKREAERIETLIHKELITSGLISEKITLERDIAMLLDKEKDRVATVTFLFREPKRTIYESIRPVIGIFNVKCTIAISPSSMPGANGNLTVGQYQGLLGEGNSAAILYDGSKLLSKYLDEVSVGCETLGIEMPKVLYVCGTYEGKGIWLTEYDSDGNPIFTADLNNTLSKYGIEQVVQETYQTKLVAYEHFYEPFIYCEALGFNAMNDSVGRLASGSLYEALKNKAAVVYSINFEMENSYGAFYGEYDSRLYSGDGTTTDDFVRMLRAVCEYGSSIMITDVGSVAEYRYEYNEKLQIDTDSDELLEQFTQRLVEVNAAIEAIKKKYD